MKKENIFLAERINQYLKNGYYIKLAGRMGYQYIDLYDSSNTHRKSLECGTQKEIKSYLRGMDKFYEISNYKN